MLKYLPTKLGKHFSESVNYLIKECRNSAKSHFTFYSVCFLSSYPALTMTWSSTLVIFLIFSTTSVLATTSSSDTDTDSNNNTQNDEVAEFGGDTNTVILVKPKPESPEDSMKCFSVDVNQFCLQKDTSDVKSTGCSCAETSLDATAIVCCNVTDIAKSLSCIRSNESTYEKIHIINARQSELNVTTLKMFKTIKSLAITDGNISRITGQFAMMTSHTCLNFSNNNITEISDRALSNLSSLKLLDLSSNNLTKLPSLKNQIFIDIRKNHRITCRSVHLALDRGIEFLHKNVSECVTPVVYSWFRDTVSVQLLNLENVKKITNCPEKCLCEEDGIVFPSEDVRKAIAVVKVNCSDLRLAKLPEKLPENTYTLVVSNNSITSLAPIANNDYYHNVRALFADDNQISSIEDLGKKFLINFTKLSLRNNKIKYIPYIFLTNLERNSSAIVHFAGNPFYCDCSTATPQNQRVSWRNNGKIFQE